MRLLPMTRLNLLLLVVVLSGAPLLTPGSARASEKTQNALPKEIDEALRTPEKVTLYSLEPVKPGAGDEALYGFKVLGHTDLNNAQAAEAINAFRSAVADWGGAVAMCFNARHALRVRANKHTYDLLLCYECQQLDIFRDGKSIAWLGASGSPKVLNGLLTAGGIALAQTEEDVQRRWTAAMPASIRPLWTKPMWQQTTFNVGPMREALAAEIPDSRQRIIALFSWLGSGEGPWSGYSWYETVPQVLLFDFSTSDLIAVANSTNLNERQIEGAARFFADSEFAHRRPKDLATLPTELKKKLLDHSLKTTDDWKLSSAQKAFGPP